jgi:hypothetical protein
MPRGKRELAEQITPKLREVEVEVGRGKTVVEAVKKIGVTEQTYSLGRRSSMDLGNMPIIPPGMEGHAMGTKPVRSPAAPHTGQTI